MRKIIFGAFAVFAVLWISMGSSAFDKPMLSDTEYFPIKQKDSTLAKSMERGAGVYHNFCTQCHLENGEGVASTFPPLADADYLLENREKSIHAVKYGLQGEITVNGETYNGMMASPGLYDDEIADVMNYILNSWGNESKTMVTEEEVASIEE